MALLFRYEYINNHNYIVLLNLLDIKYFSQLTTSSILKIIPHNKK